MRVCGTPIYIKKKKKKKIYLVIFKNKLLLLPIYIGGYGLEMKTKIVFWFVEKSGKRG